VAPIGDFGLAPPRTAGLNITGVMFRESWQDLTFLGNFGNGANCEFFVKIF
jgi:hypothetical protein